MARLANSFLLPDEEEAPPTPWAALLRAQGMAPPPVPAVGNASPAEAPGQSAEAYAAAAQAERAKGNQDTAGRLTVQATEARTQEQSAQGTPEPATPLAPAAVAAPAAQPRPAKPPSEEGLEQKPFSFQTAESTREGGDMSSPALYKPLEEPPPYVPPSKTGSFFALALDAMMNKGRNVGRIVGQLAQGDDAYTNYQRRVRAAKDAAQIEASKRRGVLSPEEQALKEARLKIAQDSLGLRKEQIEAQGDSLELRREAQAVKNDPKHPIADRVRQNLYAQGVQPGSLDGLSLDAMKSGNNASLKNMVEQAQSTEMAAVAAEKANAVANATDDNKIRVAEGISDATQANKIELAQAQAGVQAGKAETQAALTEEQAINTERRKRLVAQNRERTTLESILARVEAKGDESLPMQGHFIERGIVRLKADVGGGTGMNEADSELDNDLTMAGLQNYITGAGNAPNSEREQDVASRKFRGNGTYSGAASAIRARLAEMDKAEDALREEEDATRIHRRAPAAPRKPRAAAPRKPTANVVAADDLEF
jgi:hypothetical protein